MVDPVRVELTPFRLRVGCSTIELRVREPGGDRTHVRRGLKVHRYTSQLPVHKMEWATGIEPAFSAPLRCTTFVASFGYAHKVAFQTGLEPASSGFGNRRASIAPLEQTGERYEVRTRDLRLDKPLRFHCAKRPCTGSTGRNRTFNRILMREPLCH